jgi:cytochrome c
MSKSASTAFAISIFLLAGAASPALSQDAEAGAKVFAKCRACHSIGETSKNGVGPSLNGIIGRAAGAYAGYNFSEANKSSGITWDEATFSEYIAAPAAKIKGTKMAFAGLKNPQEVLDIVAYLKQFGLDGKKQ